MNTSRKTGPKTKRLARDRLYRLIYEQALEDDSRFLEEARRAVPDAWHFVEMDIEVHEPKVKLTLYLDQSVAKIFKAMGGGYQTRINRVLTTWVQMRIAEMNAYEMDHYQMLEATRAELRADPPKDIRDKRADTLTNSWAYLQGYEDAMKEVAEKG
ncbi:MAG: BrnA antitoxin family protein [Paracoccaceae bacterium]